MDESFSRAKEGFKKVLNLKKQPRKQDYYAILGVKRNADVKEINRAYRYNLNILEKSSKV